MTLHEKLNLIQTKLEAPKDLYNKFGNYRYRSAESILAATKPFLREMGLTLVTESKISEHLNRIYVECTVTISDGKTSESASGMAREEETKKGMDGSQITGAAMSYAKNMRLVISLLLTTPRMPTLLNTRSKCKLHNRVQQQR